MKCRYCGGNVRHSNSWRDYEEGYEDFWCIEEQEYRAESEVDFSETKYIG